MVLQNELPLDQRALILRGKADLGTGPQLVPNVTLSGQLSPRLPGTVEVSASGDAWRASYHAENVTFGVGQIVLAGTTLQPKAELFGVNAALRRSGWGVGVSAGMQEEAFAGAATLSYVGTQTSAAVGVSTSAKSRTLAADFSVRQGALRGQASGALDLDTGAPKVNVGVDYTGKQTSVKFGVQYQAPDFAGQPAPDLSFRATVQAPLSRELTGTLSSTAQMDPVTPGSTVKWSVAGRLASRTSAWESFLKMTAGQPTSAGISFDQRGTWRAGLTWTPGALDIQTTAAWHAGSLSLRPSVGAHVNLTAAEVFTSFGLQAGWTYKGGNASLGMASPAFQGDGWTVDGSTTLSLGTQLNNADLKLSGRLNVGAGPPKAQLRASLSYPLELVSARRGNVGTLKGRLQAPDGTPLTGVRLRAGALTAVTDNDGRYTFPDVLEGPVELNLVGDELSRVQARPAFPLQVEIHGGKTSTVDVQLSPGAVLQGRLVLKWPDEQAAAGKLIVPDQPPLSSLTLRLTGADLSYDVRVNADGTFETSGLQSGTYDAKLLLPTGQRLINAQLTSTVVQVGQEARVFLTLELVPITQDVQIEDGGELQLK